MGAITATGTTTYLSIIEGKICQKVQQPTATSRSRTNKLGKVIHEELYKGWDGLITDLRVKDSDYGKQWEIKMTDEDGSVAIIQLPYSGGASSAFLKTLPNIDFTKKVTLVPDLKIDNEKKRTTLFVLQEGAPVKWYFTKDNPNGLPPMKKVKVKGVEQWDDSEAMEFLEKMVENEILLKIHHARQARIKDVEEKLFNKVDTSFNTDEF